MKWRKERSNNATSPVNGYSSTTIGLVGSRGWIHKIQLGSLVDVLFFPTTKYLTDVVLDDIVLRSVDERVGSDVEQDECLENIPCIAEHVQRKMKVH